MSTISIDFDGVIHRYSQDWKDGSIYDIPMEGAFESISKLLRRGYTIFVMSTRDPKQIKEWFDKYKDSVPFKTEIVSDNTPFWNKTNIVGITNRKLAASVYIDDRGLRFTNWSDITKYFV